ncbi:hypothetical protein ACRAWF_39805 [Streptomyces sp. L7]
MGTETGLGEPLGEAVVRRLAAAPRRQAGPAVRGGVRPRCAGPALGGRDALALHRRRDRHRQRAGGQGLVHPGPPASAAIRRRDGTGLPARRAADRAGTDGRRALREPTRIRSAAEQIRKRVAEAQAPALLDRIETGRQITFGPLTADAHGLFLPGGLTAYRWAEMREPYPAVDLPDFPVPASWWLRPRDVRLVLRGRDGHGDPHRTELPAWEVVNWGALVVLWRRLGAC